LKPRTRKRESQKGERQGGKKKGKIPNVFFIKINKRSYKRESIKDPNPRKSEWKFQNNGGLPLII
jgi:hypothetical protein